MYSKSNVYIYADVIRNNIENVCEDYVGDILYAYALWCFISIYYHLINLNLLSQFIII